MSAAIFCALEADKVTPKLREVKTAVFEREATDTVLLRLVSETEAGETIRSLPPPPDGVTNRPNEILARVLMAVSSRCS